jgi:hypothetical protein
MASESETPLDRLWKEYESVFLDFDDLTLGRWMAQTLGQLQGRVWRLSHPLIGTYRLAAHAAHERQIWLKRLVSPPGAYPEAECCRAPLVPVLTRDVVESGLVCQHCGETAVPFEAIPSELQTKLEEWASAYSPVHEVAHWDDEQQEKSGDYDKAFENAAQEAERMLSVAGLQLAPNLLDNFPVIVWEDQDECLEVRPEDIPW